MSQTQTVDARSKTQAAPGRRKRPRTESERILALAEQRPNVLRAHKTNNILTPPPGVQGAELRRWRDLLGHYVGLLGDRIRQEQCRVLVTQLVSLTLLAERLQEQIARKEPVDPNYLIQSSQTIMRLLVELGLDPSPQSPAQSPAAPRAMTPADAVQMLRELGLPVPDFDSVIDHHEAAPSSASAASTSCTPPVAEAVVAPIAEEPSAKGEPPPARSAPAGTPTLEGAPPASSRIPAQYERYARAASFSLPGAKS